MQFQKKIIYDDLSYDEIYSFLFLSSYLDEVLSIDGIDFIIDFYTSDLLQIDENNTISVKCCDTDITPKYSISDMHKIVYSILYTKDMNSIFSSPNPLFDFDDIQQSWVYWYINFAVNPSITKIVASITNISIIYYALSKLGLECSIEAGQKYIHTDIMLIIDRKSAK